MRLHLQKIKDAVTSRPEGYYDDVISRGDIVGDFLEISSEALSELREKYRQYNSIESSSAPLPPLSTMASNLTTSVFAEVKAMLTDVPDIDSEKIASRLSICETCESFTQPAGRCTLCGCYMNFKTRLKSATCPVGKW